MAWFANGDTAMSRLLATLCLLALPLAGLAQMPPPPPLPLPPTAGLPRVELQTSQGTIVIALYQTQAPKSTANFLHYVQDGYYDGTVFHRSIPGYLLQGGLYSQQLVARRTAPAIPSEADNGLSNLRGTIAVARGADPNSGTSQFFFNLADNRRLDHVGNQSGLTWGYTVFGKVVSGMDVVERIAALPTHPQGPFTGDVPNPLVVITHAQLEDASSTDAKPSASH
ncbi:peptidyl-prolyl cis-trans isomerase (rotamase) - cyclophilin family [Frateuria aurantia DSM 6220]|uniref:Peptidyl-prolyl cis-trans isomerase n=2 Tax=Frateuria aurantia TaxID=81475 RepID=H8L701_FRAAD|nr:peptidyl-prolyl cis-trans isomerase (rotamase) - cyclophilin family [Frateuria aurantia DSM 6220]